MKEFFTILRTIILPLLGLSIMACQDIKSCDGKKQWENIHSLLKKTEHS